MENHIDPFATKVVQMEETKFDHPVVIGGFIGPTLVGLLSASYIIEQMKLHQVAHVKSRHIPPVAVFVGGKLRNPFRIYRNDKGNVVVMICEVPIDDEGLYEVSSALLTWIDGLDPKEVVILDGAPIPGIPENRKTFCVAEEGRFKDFKEHGVEVAESALITGMGGAILNECLARRTIGTSLLTHVSVNFPDPGAVLALIDSMNSIYSLGIDTDVLEKNVTQLHKEINKVVEQYKQKYQKRGETPETMYG